MLEARKIDQGARGQSDILDWSGFSHVASKYQLQAESFGSRQIAMSAVTLQGSFWL